MAIFKTSLILKGELNLHKMMPMGILKNVFFWQRLVSMPHFIRLFIISNKNNTIKRFGFSFGCYTCNKKCYNYWANKKNLKFRIMPDNIDLYIYVCIFNLKISLGYFAFEFFFISQKDVKFFVTRVTSKTKIKAFYSIVFIKKMKRYLICNIKYYTSWFIVFIALYSLSS